MKSQTPFVLENALSILIVDDSPMFLHLITEYLERSPIFTVVSTASTGEDAFLKAHISRPWIILIDLDMHIFTNPNAILYLRGQSPASTIIALTLLEDHVPLRSREIFGVDAIVAKSQIFQKLTHVILSTVGLSLGVIKKSPSSKIPIENPLYA